MPFHERDDLGFDAPAPLGHPARSNMPEGAPTGPAIGERLPDFQLTDDTGRLVDIAVPFYPRAELVSECRPLDRDSVPIEVLVRYQACDNATCLMPRNASFRFDIGLEPVDMPNLAFHGDTGQRKSPMDSAPHLRRLVLRQLRHHPLGALRSIVGQIRLRIERRRRS